MNPYLQDADFTLYNGDALETLRELPAESVQMCVTSPPFFGLRDYGTGTWEGGYADDCDHKPPKWSAKGADTSTLVGTPQNHEREGWKDVCGQCGARRVDRQIGLEATPEEWVASLVAVFEEVKRVLRADGTLWVECGDSYNGAGSNTRTAAEWSSYKETYDSGGQSIPAGWGERAAKPATRAVGCKPKDLIGQPFLLAFALREAGWYWRNVCIWHKPNPMPESVRDRFTVSHSYVLLFSKSPRYFFDAEAVREEVTGNARTRGNDVNPKTAGDTTGMVKRASYFNDVVTARNARSVWSIATEPLPFEHYAAFPQALAERAIKAGTSERGCCPECGAPWVRETEGGEGTYPQRKALGYDKPANMQHHGVIHPPGMNRDLTPSATVTTGWRPGCEHRIDFGDGARSGVPESLIPCTILDPFLGSGTSALVARRLNRHCIGIELNKTYCELIARRTQQLSLETETV